MHIMAPVSAGTDKVVPLQTASTQCRQALRQGGDDHKRIEPGLKVHHDQHVDQHDGRKQTQEQAGEGGIHRDHLPAQGDGCALGGIVCRVGDQFPDVACNTAQIAILRRGIEVDGRHDVVMRDDRARLLAADMSERTQHLKAG